MVFQLVTVLPSLPVVGKHFVFLRCVVFPLVGVHFISSGVLLTSVGIREFEGVVDLQEAVEDRQMVEFADGVATVLKRPPGLGLLRHYIMANASLPVFTLSKVQSGSFQAVWARIAAAFGWVVNRVEIAKENERRKARIAFPRVEVSGNEAGTGQWTGEILANSLTSPFRPQCK